MWKRVGKSAFKVGAGFTFLGANVGYVAYKYRPRSSKDVDYHENMVRIACCVVHCTLSYPLFCAQLQNITEPSGIVEKTLYSIGRVFIVTLIGSVYSTLIKRFNQFEYIDGHKLDPFIANRPKGTPLITVSNHSSVVDDPGLASAIVPMSVLMDPRKMRWTVCTEEICFDDPKIGAFFGLGKGIPILRGGSIHQKGIATLMQRANSGDWVHLFPEGRCWQEHGHPLRDEQGRWCSASGRCGKPWTKIGPLKWGIGKVVANSEKKPIVVPIYHQGFNDIAPHGLDNSLLYINFFKNVHVTAKVGDPLDFTDLIEEYHRGAHKRAMLRNLRREAYLKRVLSEEMGTELSMDAYEKLALDESIMHAPDMSRHPVTDEDYSINTTDEGSDHTGASARIASISKTLPKELYQYKDKQQSYDIIETLGEQLDTAMESAVESAVEVATRMEGKAIKEADKIAQRARELVTSIVDAIEKRAENMDIPQGKEAAHKAADFGKKVAAHIPDLSSLHERGPISKFAKSVSVPKPPSFAVKESDRHTIPVKLEETESVHKQQHSDPILDLISKVPLSDEPVVELIPTRKLDTGLQVPAYVEAPLHIKPPDHLYLTPSEAIEEDSWRLKLYSDIAMRVQTALEKLENEVMAHRKAKGIVEPRDMR